MSNSLPGRSGRSRKVALAHYSQAMDRCWFCGLDIPGVLEVAHIDQDRANDHPDNLAILCPTCHRLLDVGVIARAEIIQAKAEHLDGRRVHQPSLAHEVIAREISSGLRTVDWRLLSKGAQQRAGKTIKLKAAAKRAWITRRRNAAMLG